MKNKLDRSNSKIWQHKVVEYLVYFAILVIPLFFDTGHIYSFTIPKFLIMHLVSILMVIFYLWGNFCKDNFKLKLSLLNMVLIFFVLVLTLSSILGIDPVNSFFGWSNVTPLVTIYALSIFALVLGLLIRKNKNIINNILAVSLFSSVIVTLIFYFTSSGNSIYIKDGSTIGNNSYLGAYLLFNFFFGIALFLSQKKLFKKIIIGLSTLFILINPIFINKDFLLGKISLGQVFSHPFSLLGMANGAFIGIGFSILFIIFLFMAFSNKKKVKVLGISLVIILFISIFAIGNNLMNPDTNLHKLYVSEKSNNRFLAWDIAEKGFITNPILGNGFNNYIYTFDKYYNADFYRSGYFVENFTYPHNVIYEFASNNGVLGVISYVILLVVTIFSLLPFRKSENVILDKIKIIFAGLLLGYFIQNLFIFDTICTYLMLFTIIAFALGFSSQKEFNLNPKYFKLIYIIIIIFSAYLISPFVVQPWVESSKDGRMIKSGSISKFSKLRDGVSDISMFGGLLNDVSINTKLSNIYQRKIYEIKDDRDKEIFNNEIDSIIRLLDKDIIRQPYYSGSYVLMSQLLNIKLFVNAKQGNYFVINSDNYDKDIWGKSYDLINKGLKLNPNNPPAYLILSQLYFIKKDMSNARLYCEKAIDMAPEYKDAQDFMSFVGGPTPEE